MKTDSEGRAQLQVIDAPSKLLDAPSRSGDKAEEIWKLATTLDEERWRVRDKIGALYQRALTHFLGSAGGLGLASVADHNGWEVPLLILAVLGFVSATSAAMSGFRYRRLFRAKWSEEIEHLLLRFARQSGNTLRTVDVAEHLRVSITESERLLEDMRRRSLVTTDVDATGTTLYQFPNRR